MSDLSPVFLMAFNRPQYVKQVISSLEDQIDIGNREFHAFVDGPVSNISGKRYGDDDDIDAVINVISSSKLPFSIHRSNVNLGTFLSFLKAEEFGFQSRKFDCIYFFEDDMELSSHYLKTMDVLRALFEKDGDVGYFAAYGQHTTHASERHKHRHKLLPLEHHWGFGLFRSHWLAMRPVIEEYSRIIGGVDYRDRDHVAVRTYFERLGVFIHATSQDEVKAAATMMLRKLRLNTLTCHGRYIGEIGSNFSKEIYAKMGFDKDLKMDDFVDNYNLPSALEMYQIFAAKLIRNGMIGTLTASSSAVDEKIICRKEDVDLAYRLILGRAPENEGVYKGRVGALTLRQLGDQMLRSEEFYRRRFYHLKSGLSISFSDILRDNK